MRYINLRFTYLLTYIGLMEFAGVDNAAPLWQGWTMQEWGEVTKAAYKITSLANDSLYI